MQVPEPIRRFWRETISPRPIAAGSAAAVAAGLAVGAYLAAGAGFEPPPPMKPAPRGAVHRLEAAPQPITLMKDADGKTPDWVIGTDNIPGRQNWRDRLPVATVPDDEDRPPERARRGLDWLLPWRWGRDEAREGAREADGREIGPPRPNRRISSYRENQAAAAAAERAERERERRDRYAETREAEMAAMEEERRARTRYRPRYEPRYDPRDQEAELEVYEDEPPPPPGRWRSGR